MKKTFLLTLLCIILLIGVTKLKSQTLVSSYPFNGNANDAAGTANGTVLGGATLTTDRFGNANSAYNFDGIDDYIEANADDLPTGDHSVSLWFKADAGSINAKPGLLGYGGNAGACPGNSFFMSLTVSAGVSAFVTSAHCGSNQSVYNYPVFPEEKWYHWVVTTGGTTIKMYVNGVLVSTSNTNTQTKIVAGKKLNMGVIVSLSGTSNYTDGNVGRYKGVLDDVKIYNGTLTDAQVFDSYINDIKKPGSGNGIQLTRTGAKATDPWINVGNGFDFGTQSFTYETWVKRDDLHTTAGNFGIGLMLSENNNGWGVGIDNNNLLFLTKIGVNAVYSTGTIADLKWHHVTIVYNGTQVQFYIDGVAAGTSPYTDNFNSAGNYTIGARQSFGNADGDQTLNGMIDETRIWRNIALTQTQIRDWMCRKITSAHPAYTNLFAYFRFDEGSSLTTCGYNGKFGTLVNTPTWLTSGAALGDASAHDFTNATKTANINAATGENFAVTSTSGNPDGIQVYRVDEQPNTLTGATGVGNNNKYFGVFQVGGTSPQYTAVYNYTGNPGVNTNNENQLRLFKRTDNAVTNWSMLSSLPDNPTNTITVTGESTEYILGSIGLPLPLTLINFGATKCNSGVCLFWSTENEQDFSHFEIEKSNDASIFLKMTTVQARNSSGANAYSSIDIAPGIGNNYYRLKQVNSDGSFIYSRIIKIALQKPKVISLQPNPAVNTMLVKGIEDYQQIKITDINGKVLMQKSIKATIEEISISQFAKGIYLLQLSSATEIKTIQFVKQ